MRAKIEKHNLQAAFGKPVASHRGGRGVLRGRPGGVALLSPLTPWPSQESVPALIWDSTRFLAAYVRVNRHCLMLVITLYGYPKNSTYHDPAALNDRLFTQAAQLATYHNGPVVINGDLNQGLEAFTAWPALLARCWQDAAATSSDRHQHPPRPTSRGDARHTFILINAQ